MLPLLYQFRFYLCKKYQLQKQYMKFAPQLLFFDIANVGFVIASELY